MIFFAGIRQEAIEVIMNVIIEIPPLVWVNADPREKKIFLEPDKIMTTVGVNETTEAKIGMVSEHTFDCPKLAY